MVPSIVFVFDCILCIVAVARDFNSVFLYASVMSIVRVGISDRTYFDL